MVKDLTGQRFGRLTVLEEEPYDYSPGYHYWKCKCDCGNIVSVNGKNLKAGNTRSCGCLRKEVSTETIKKYAQSRLIDLTGQRFGRLTVIERADDRIIPCGKRYVRWLCKCDCGNMKVVESSSLRYGWTKSCGCLRRKKHEL